MRYNMWTREEKACVKECTKKYFEGYRKIIRYTNKQAGEDVWYLIL